jgi:sporulation protein YlmC with PRC-barrel domain
LEKYTKFQTAIDKLKIKYTTSLLQQYLLKYIDEPDEALINIECMKKIGDSAIIDNGGEGMYN